MRRVVYFLFFQAEDGIRDLTVTGVQTCALPISLEMQGARPFQQDLSFNTPLIAVLDNNLYYQYAVLARIYDWSKGGEQTFPVLIPQDLTPGTVRVASTGSASADGKTYEGLKVSSSDLEIQLLLDNNHRLIRLEVPEARDSVIRE